MEASPLIVSLMPFTSGSKREPGSSDGFGWDKTHSSAGTFLLPLSSLSRCFMLKACSEGPGSTGGSAHLPGLCTPPAPSIFPGEVGLAQAFTPSRAGVERFWGALVFSDEEKMSAVLPTTAPQ